LRWLKIYSAISATALAPCVLASERTPPADKNYTISDVTGFTCLTDAPSRTGPDSALRLFESLIAEYPGNQTEYTTCISIFNLSSPNLVPPSPPSLPLRGTPSPSILVYLLLALGSRILHLATHCLLHVFCRYPNPLQLFRNQNEIEDFYPPPYPHPTFFISTTSTPISHSLAYPSSSSALFSFGRDSIESASTARVIYPG
jgi:hypothetical protein